MLICEKKTIILESIKKIAQTTLIQGLSYFYFVFLWVN